MDFLLGLVIQFHNDKFANPAGLVEFMHDQRGTAKIKDNKIIVLRDWSRKGDKVKGAYIIVRDLAALANPKAA